MTLSIAIYFKDTFWSIFQIPEFSLFPRISESGRIFLCGITKSGSIFINGIVNVKYSYKSKCGTWRNAGRSSAWLVKHELVHRSLGFDYKGRLTWQIKPENWYFIALISYVYGYNYLRSQYAYDVAPGGLLASVYHLTRIQYGVDQPE